MVGPSNKRMSRRGLLAKAGGAVAGGAALALVGAPRGAGVAAMGAGVGQAAGRGVRGGQTGAGRIGVAQAGGGYFAWNGGAAVDPGTVLADGAAVWRWNAVGQLWEVHAKDVSAYQVFQTLEPRAYYLSHAPAGSGFVGDPGDVTIGDAASSVQLVPGANLLVYQGPDGASVQSVLAAAAGAVSRVDNGTGATEVYNAGLGVAQPTGDLTSLRRGGVYSLESSRLVHVAMPFESGLLRGIEAEAGVAVSALDTTTLMAGTLEGAAYFVGLGAPLLPATVLGFADLDALYAAWSAVVTQPGPPVAQIWMNGQAVAIATAGHVFINTASPGWGALNAVERYKVLTHEYVHIVQQGSAGLAESGPPEQAPPIGPVWLGEGSAEFLGFLATAAAGLWTYAEARATPLMRAGQISVPLESMGSFAGWQGSGGGGSVLDGAVGDGAAGGGGSVVAVPVLRVATARDDVGVGVRGGVRPVGGCVLCGV